MAGQIDDEPLTVPAAVELAAAVTPHRAGGAEPVEQQIRVFAATAAFAPEHPRLTSADQAVRTSPGCAMVSPRRSLGAKVVREPLRVRGELRGCSRLPVIRAQHRTDVVKVRRRPAFGIDHRTVAAGAQPEAVRVGYRKTVA